ncbi:MAG: hypothetical protein H7Y38_00170, partial [Armatimonadetes bacterium]|nr:hypothetical protein [Armatimonadota bacterium]
VTTPSGELVPQKNIWVSALSATLTGEFAAIARIVYEARQREEYAGSDSPVDLTKTDFAYETAQFLKQYEECSLVVLVTPTDASLDPQGYYSSRERHANGALIGKYRVAETGETYHISSHDSSQTDAEGRFKMFVFPGVRYKIQAAGQGYINEQSDASPGSFTVTPRSGQAVENVILRSPEPLPKKPKPN